ncbi:hypothetical protein H04402_02579 [Clostridium botulinum H04402 065]|uniref:hypothetical protein n=1 Tax=Clostridium botulinum TaxID=1491 RepID=UPI0001F84A0D|nr:hypothetical protein [Clostridium botulinum]CBZ04386.1 hypothetical protein H04402_02579 [Clostridium botulinum H04402 065]
MVNHIIEPIFLAIMDLHNNEIISYKLSISLGIEFVRDTLIEAFSGKKANDLRKLIIHSDQGVHYRSLIYKNLIKEIKLLKVCLGKEIATIMHALKTSLAILNRN